MPPLVLVRNQTALEGNPRRTCHRDLSQVDYIVYAAETHLHRWDIREGQQFQ